MNESFDDKEFLIVTAQGKISQGINLIEQLNFYKNVPGTQKIQRKINQEIKFLKKVGAGAGLFSHSILLI